MYVCIQVEPHLNQRGLCASVDGAPGIYTGNQRQRTFGSRFQPCITKNGRAGLPTLEYIYCGSLKETP
jgi:hypothetical protein